MTEAITLLRDYIFHELRGDAYGCPNDDMHEQEQCESCHQAAREHAAAMLHILRNHNIVLAKEY